MSKSRWLIAVLCVGVAGVAAWRWWPRDYCRGAHDRYGLKLAQCPDGQLRQRVQLSAEGLRRTGPGTVQLSATALYTVSTADQWLEAPIKNFQVKLSLVNRAGDATPIKPLEKWQHLDDESSTAVRLPEVPDGDYKLRAEVTSRVATNAVELPLALYAPAKIHLVTDRPLYEPGNTVQFRALAVRAQDLAPIDHREGQWEVRDPAGELLLQELAPAGEWGVVAGNFPLDREATPGSWSVTWRSGDEQTTTNFQVEPFTLPRFRVEAAADSAYYQPGASPTLSGAVLYSSGAPVANAQLTIAWRVDSSGWPAPTNWATGALPTKATADVTGRFHLQLPEVPADLLGQARLVARVAAVDDAGDRVEGSASVLLSQDAIQVEAITELSDGLVDGFNNRIYLRVTTADGKPLPGAELRVKPAWSAADEALVATLDQDAVARLQLDPGPPVNVVIPAPPVRPPPPATVVRRSSAHDYIAQSAPSMADQIALDRWNARIAACARWAGTSTASARLAVRVNAAGAVIQANHDQAPINRCVADAIRGQRLARGKDRLLSLGYELNGSMLPTLSTSIAEPLDEFSAVREPFSRAALDARACLPTSFDGTVAWPMQWIAREGSRTLQVTWVRDGGSRATSVPTALASCIQTRFARHELTNPAPKDHLGLVRFSVTVPGRAGRSKSRPRIRQGYELAVSAIVDGAPIGDTKIFLAPGSIPALRIRTTPVIASAGDTIEVELIRGPSFSGEVPKKLVVDHLGNKQEVEIDTKKRTASFQLADDARGWFQVTAGDSRALVYARSGESLAVQVKPDQANYRPGATAQLAITTAVAGNGAKAAVGLFGVDESLAQLTPLTGPDDLRSLRPTVPMSAPAFGVLEAQALALGRIRGDNAAEATVLRVTSVPTPPQLDVQLHGSASSPFDPVAELTDRFYPILGELHTQTRAWEQTAAEGELMTPEVMARLWKQALTASQDRGLTVVDAFGRRLRLHRLPEDLLALTAPRAVVVVGTRLPEDVENWSEWVQRRRP